MLPSHRSPARPYYKGICGPVLLLRHVSGSALPRVLPWATLAAAYTAVLHTQVTCNAWPSFCSNGHPAFEREERDFLFVHTYSYHAILLASGFGLVFRVNQSLTRYWEARTAAQNMASKWCDVVLMALTFDEEDAPAHAERKQTDAFARCFTHLMSLLHATAVHTLRGDTSLESLQPRGKAPQAAAAPRCCAGWDDYGSSAAGPIEHLGALSPPQSQALGVSAARVHVVLGWVARLMVRRRRQGGLAVDAPVVSRLHQYATAGSNP